jgi:hypothetical protein
MGVYVTLSKTLRTGFCGLWILASNIVMHGSAVAESRIFQQGIDGYAGTEDLHRAIPPTCIASSVTETSRYAGMILEPGRLLMRRQLLSLRSLPLATDPSKSRWKIS